MFLLLLALLPAPRALEEHAAVAYDRYQRCGLKGARRLLVTGW
jgi:hypothetical protein